jgi:hypothetical protein
MYGERGSILQRYGNELGPLRSDKVGKDKTATTLTRGDVGEAPGTWFGRA